MSSNKSARQQLIRRYGSIDFLDKLKIKVPSSVRYKSKGQLKKMKQLTYHHIKERSKGGETTIENGALLTWEHHEWFHQQSSEIQQELNSAFQELKRRIDRSKKVSIMFVEEEELDFPFMINLMKISVDKQGRIKAYNRSKKKRENKKEIDEYDKDEI